MGLAHGTLGWADVAVPDMAAGTDFYGGVFGWEAIDGDGGEAMPYTMFAVDGKVVAGMGALSQQQIGAGQPPMWSPYVIVDDVDAAFAAAVTAGATPLMEPMEILDAGKMFFVLDPTGAAVGFWQSGTHDGAQLFNVPNTMTWNDLATRDVDGAKRFYSGLLGWETSDMDAGEIGTYTTFTNGDRANGGTWDMTGTLPDEIPAHWLTWFSVADCEATAAKTVELGGEIRRAAEPSPMGVTAVLADPWGAVFAVIQANESDGQPPR